MFYNFLSNDTQWDPESECIICENFVFWAKHILNFFSPPQ